MKCPACDTEMQEVTAGDVEVDICSKGCGGIWFDAGELDKFEDGQDFDPQSLVNLKGANKEVDQNAIRKCPRCADEVLVRQFYDVEGKVQINQCYNCSGIFLDKGELTILRSEYKTEAEHKAAVEAYAQRCVDEQIKEVNEDTKEWEKEYEEKHHSRFECAVAALKELVTGSDE